MMEKTEKVLKIANELMQWGVYAMNDCDIVAAKSEEKAKKFYEEFISREEIDEEFEGEADISQEIRIFSTDLSDVEREKVTEILGGKVLENENGEFRCTLLEWLEVMVSAGQTDTFIIASTEY